MMLTARWDASRKSVNFKIKPASTSKFILLSPMELRSLRAEIDKALEAHDDSSST